MSDCTGYGINQDIRLNVSGPVGNGNVADLTVTISDNFSPFEAQNFDDAKTVTVNNWDGSDITIDVTPLLRQMTPYSFVGANCDLAARLTVSSRGDNSGGTMLLEFIFTNCAASTNSSAAQVFENCGGAGPHVVSQTQSFFFQAPR